MPDLPRIISEIRLLKSAFLARGDGRFFDFTNRVLQHPDTRLRSIERWSPPFGDVNLGASVTLGRCAGLMKYRGENHHERE